VLLGTNEERLGKVKEEVSDKVSVKIIKADFKNTEEVERAIEEILKYTKGQVDILINNAGIYYQTDKSAEEVMAVNFYAPKKLTEELLPALENSDEAAIVNVISKTALPESKTGKKPKDSPYRKSKVALKEYTEELKEQLKDVQVVAVYTGGMKTPFRKKDISPESKRYKGWLEPKTVAEKIVKILASDASYDIEMFEKKK